MLQIENIFHAGRITKAHAFSGHIKVVFLPTFQPVQEPKGTVFLMINKKPVPFFIEEVIQATESSIILKLEDIDTLEQANELIDLAFYLDLSYAGENQQDDFQLAFLIGFNIIDQNKKRIGIIQQVIENPAHYLLEIEHEKLIPFHEDFILNMDMDKKIIQLDLPEGLLD
jgi:16S rRNA processing protein RimM